MDEQVIRYEESNILCLMLCKQLALIYVTKIPIPKLKALNAIMQEKLVITS